MSVTSGFFNSYNNDRRYNAEQMSSIFDGVINDGVFSNIGTAFAVTADTGNTVMVGIGRAWFNSAWLLNDALLPIELEESEVILDRYDAVVIEIDHNESVRNGSIKVIKGSAASTPAYPEITKSKLLNQYPLAYIYRKAGSSEITQANITNAVGTSSCPYVTGILQVQDIDNIVAQWEAQWDEWYAREVENASAEQRAWLDEARAEYETWFSTIRGTLSGDVAAGLAAGLASLESRVDVNENVANRHASRHHTTGADPISPADIGAAPAGHGHTPESIGAAPANHGHTPESIGAAAANHGHTPESIGAAAATHGHSAADITAGTTFGATNIHAKTGTDYSTQRIRNIAASTTDLTAGSSSLANGNIYFVYE